MNAQVNTSEIKSIEWRPNFMALLPLPQQFIKVFLAQLQRGKLKAGDILPSIKTVSKRHLVSFDVVQEAYYILFDEGYISRLPDDKFSISCDNSSVNAHRSDGIRSST